MACLNCCYSGSLPLKSKLVLISGAPTGVGFVLYESKEESENALAALPALRNPEIGINNMLTVRYSNTRGLKVRLFCNQQYGFLNYSLGDTLTNPLARFSLCLCSVAPRLNYTMDMQPMEVPLAPSGVSGVNCHRKLTFNSYLAFFTFFWAHIQRLIDTLAD